MEVFILAGQSNMAGRGGVVFDKTTGLGTWNGLVPPECLPNPSIIRLNANLRWVEASEPLHEDIDVNKTNGIGPGMAFANAVLSKDRTFGLLGLVPCALGGTNISEWNRGTFLYNQMVERAQASRQRGGMIRALLWYQGESDTVSRTDALLYKTRLSIFFTDVRHDLQSPMLPIFQVALATGEGPYVDIVRKGQLELYLPNLRTVDAQGLAIEPDGLHLTTSAQVYLGEKMADAFLEFEGASPRGSMGVTNDARGNRNVYEPSSPLVRTNDFCGFHPYLRARIPNIFTMETEGKEFVNEQGAVETKVETVDRRSSAGKEPTEEKVGVVHLTRKKNGSDSQGVVDRAAASLVSSFQSVKDSISGGDSPKNNPSATPPAK